MEYPFVNLFFLWKWDYFYRKHIAFSCEYVYLFLKIYCKFVI